MGKYRNMVIAVAFVEFIAAGVIAGARANDVACAGTATKVEQTSGVPVTGSKDGGPTSAHMVCSDMPIACSP